MGLLGWFFRVTFVATGFVKVGDQSLTGTHFPTDRQGRKRLVEIQFETYAQRNSGTKAMQN